MLAMCGGDVDREEVAEADCEDAAVLTTSDGPERNVSSLHIGAGEAFFGRRGVFSLALFLSISMAQEDAC